MHDMIHILNGWRNTISESVDPVREKIDIIIPDDLMDIYERMNYSGKKLYVVGGAVRDTLLGKTPKDYDLATDALPEQVIRILQSHGRLRLDLTGASFGVVRVKTPEGNEYEIATFREDIGSGRRPESVEFTTIDHDVARRDLTINALFYDISTGEVVDFVGGIDDIMNNPPIIRTVGDPSSRFAEDKLRILRAVRFAARMGSTLEDSTAQAILRDEGLRAGEGQVKGEERITEEFKKGIETADNPASYISLLHELGLLEQVLPGVRLGNPADSNNVLIQLSSLLSGNAIPEIKSTLRRMRYSGKEESIISFLSRLSSITRDSAPDLKKSFKRYKIDSSLIHGMEAAGSLEAGMANKLLQLFSYQCPPDCSPRELMARGLQGPEIGQFMRDAERELFDNIMSDMISEGISGRGLNQYTTLMSRAIVDIIKAPTVHNKINSMNTDEEIQLKNPNNIDDIILDLDDLRDVYLILSVNDEEYVDVAGNYVFNTKNRSESDFYIVLDLPRNYDFSIFSVLIPELKETIMHELEHSTEDTETLSIPPDNKWDSIENIESHFTSEAETKGYVVGLVKKAKIIKAPVTEIIDSYLMNIYRIAMSHGYNAEDMDPVMRNIRETWRFYLMSRYPEAETEEHYYEQD